jgi:hypothetical protein
MDALVGKEGVVVVHVSGAVQNAIIRKAAMQCVGNLCTRRVVKDKHNALDTALPYITALLVDNLRLSHTDMDYAAYTVVGCLSCSCC